MQLLMNPKYAAELKAWKARTSKIMKEYRRGVAKAEIARRFGVTRQRIQAIIKTEEERQQT